MNSKKISIDFWGTLGKASPDFFEEKQKLIKKYIKASNEEIEIGFYKTKNEFNDLIEKTGRQPSISFMFQGLLSNINEKYYSIDLKQLNKLILEYQKLALKIPPLIYSEETYEILKNFNELGYKLSLSCNTMFITANPIINALKIWNVGDFLSYNKFSCNQMYAKPNKYMYGESDYHIGDNQITDGIGAKLAGSYPIIINSTKLTIKDAFNIISHSK